MTNDEGPTLADDERQLGVYGRELADQVAQVAFPWLIRLVDTTSRGLVSNLDVEARLREGADLIIEELRMLLAIDPDQQPSGPLEVLRRGVRFPTAVLTDAEVPPVQRDEFSVRNFPDDIFGLTPASFADVDPSLHEPGLMWGAAKAHVHLRRRRELEPSTVADVSKQNEEQRVVVLSKDLMDQSKIKTAFPDATIVRSPAKLVQEAASATLVLVDLGQLSDPAALVAIEARVVAFGSHVDEAALQAAAATGAEAIARSVFFRRLESGDF